MLKLYEYSMRFLEPLIKIALKRRQKAGKESIERLPERLGVAGRKRPEGPLIWVHAASIGESQSTLILINTLLERYEDIHILVTTGTLTSAILMEKNLPERAFHQFYPVDHPDWVSRFLEHWQPDLILWAESELWPNMLERIRQAGIPSILVNARLSRRSYNKWRILKNSAARIIGCFSHILCQTDHDVAHFEKLGAKHAEFAGNLKYNASPLPVSDTDLQALQNATTGRPLWVYASTHEGEEEIVARTHNLLKPNIPNLLSIIVPRHPERREDIQEALQGHSLNLTLRGEDKHLPSAKTDIYIADTLGELGLFYRICPIAVIGRSFSNDGGGGHNPIEAAQLSCAVLHGPNVQNLQEIFDEMNAEGVALPISSEQVLAKTVHELITDTARCSMQQKKAYDFAMDQGQALQKILDRLQPHLDQLNICRKK